MYLILALLVGMIIGFIRRGSLVSLYDHRYRFYLLGLIGAIVLILLHFTYRVSVLNPFLGYFPIVAFIAYLLILIMLIFNLEDLYSIAIAAGVTLNFVVTFLNGGHLPVSSTVIGLLSQYSELGQSIMMSTNGFYGLMTPATMLSFFSVLIPIPVFPDLVGLTGFVPGLSVGSCFMYLGIIGAMQKAMILDRDEKPKTIEITKEPQFHSKTEELFFEDAPLPYNPLDKMFEGSDNTVRHVPQGDELSDALEELTIPLTELIRDEEFTTEVETAEFTQVEVPKKGPVFQKAPQYERTENDKADIRVPVTETMDSVYFEDAPEEPEKTVVVEDRVKEPEAVEPVVEAADEEPVKEETHTETAEIKEEPVIEEEVEKEPVVTGEEKSNQAVPEEAAEENTDQGVIQEETIQTQEDSPAESPTSDLVLEEMMNEEDYKDYKDDLGDIAEEATAVFENEPVASRDQVEEEMLDIWTQVAQENLNRKLGRKREASANYKTNNPYREELEKREKKQSQEHEETYKKQQDELVKERDRLRVEQDQMARTINAQAETMTDQQRREAGYEQVEYDINGRKIKFWRKKNES